MPFRATGRGALEKRFIMRSIRKSLIVRPCFAALLMVVALLAACSGKSDPSEDMPGQLAGLALDGMVTGQEAIDSISELHGKTLEIEAGAIGFYGRGTRPPVTVWISRAPTPEGSKEQTVLMLDLMYKGSGPFSGGKTLSAGGVEVHEFDGMGQKHYIFYRDDLAYWIAASPDLGQQALNDFLK
jgi:hypothetical protein